MTDNFAFTEGSGKTGAADDIGGVLYPRVKLTWGADGTATDTAIGAAAIPIQDGGNSITVDGSVTVGSALPAGTNAIGKLSSNAGVTIGAVELVAAQTLGTLTSITNVVHVDDNSSTLSIDDGAGALTIDFAGIAPALGSDVTTSGTLRVTLATDSAGIISTGTAGSESAQVITVQGRAGMTKLLVTPDANHSVNVGQIGGTGVATGSGTITAGTMRVLLATDQPTLTNALLVTPGGDVAHDATDSGNPIKIGFKAAAGITDVTNVSAAGDRVDAIAGKDGVQYIRPHCGLEDIVTGSAVSNSGGTVSVIAAWASGKQYLTSVVLANTSATYVNVSIKDGTTVKTVIPCPPTSGAIYNPPIPIPGTANTAWQFTCSSSVTDVTCSMVAFKSRT